MLGLALVFAAGASLIYDLGGFKARGDGELSQLGALWFQLHPGSLNLLQAGIERNIDPDIWQDRIVPFLEFPAVFALMLPGLIVLLLATFIKPRPKGNPLNR